jgi:YfiH family protein
MDNVQILQTNALATFDWLVHAFSTRPGGTSELEQLRDGKAVREKVFNLGFTDWDTREHVAANRNAFLAAIGAQAMKLVTLRQIHSDIIHAVEGFPNAQFRGDALITRVPGLLLAVQTADCIPILLADPKTRAVAAIHSGWRGTLRRIAGKVVGRMKMVFDSDPADLVAAVGPGVGRCCYEVGPEVAREYASQFPQAHEWFDGSFDALATGETPIALPWLSMAPPGHEPPAPRLQLDLLAANRAILTEAGVSPERIFPSHLCTACRTDLFFSYRREGKTGRMMAVIGLC